MVDHMLGKLVVWHPKPEHGGVFGAKVKLHKYNRPGRTTPLYNDIPYRIGKVLGMAVEFGYVWDFLPEAYSPKSPRGDFHYGPVCVVVLCGDLFTLCWAGTVFLADTTKKKKKRKREKDEEESK